MPVAFRRYLFAREPSGVIVPGGPPGIFISVDAMNKDKALERLAVRYPIIARSEWDFLEELDPEKHTLGQIGEHLHFQDDAGVIHIAPADIFRRGYH